MDDLEKFLNGVSVYVRRVRDDKMPLNWEIPPRYIFDYEFLYVKEGTVHITVEDTLYEGNVGDLFFFPPGKIHSIKSVGKECVRQPHIHFDFFYDEDSERLEIPLKMPTEEEKKNSRIREDIALKNALLQIPNKMTLKNPYQIENIFQNIFIESFNENPFSVFRKKALLCELLYLVFNYRTLNKESHCKDGTLKVVQNANVFMRKNCDRALTMGEISRAVGYSTNYFSELYKSVFKISPLKYHEKLRAEKAKSLLLSTTLSVSEIAEWLGFDSLYSFSRFFKRCVGVSPVKYKSNKIEKNKS